MHSSRPLNFSLISERKNVWNRQSIIHVQPEKCTGTVSSNDVLPYLGSSILQVVNDGEKATSASKSTDCIPSLVVCI